jgi:hypothetical protein
MRPFATDLTRHREGRISTSNEKASDGSETLMTYFRGLILVAAARNPVFHFTPDLGEVKIHRGTRPTALS